MRRLKSRGSRRVAGHDVPVWPSVHDDIRQTRRAADAREVGCAGCTTTGDDALTSQR